MEKISQEVKNTQSIGSKLAVLYADQTVLNLVSDITIVVGHREFQLHKIILCASSPIFYEMCQFGKDTKEAIPLKETEDCAEHFGDFVKYLYTGNVTLNLDNVQAIINLADKYQVEDLVEIAKTFQRKYERGNYILVS